MQQNINQQQQFNPKQHQQTFQHQNSFNRQAENKRSFNPFKAVRTAGKICRSGTNPIIHSCTAAVSNVLHRLIRKSFSCADKLGSTLNAVSITKAFIAINCLVFAAGKYFEATKGYDPLFRAGAKVNDLIQYYGEYWRLITPIFLHANIQHLLLNSISLYNLGTDIEKIIGKKRVAAILLISGLCGNIASYNFNHEISIGSSSAIFGLLGALLQIGIDFYQITGNASISKEAMFFALLNLAYGIINPQIDNAAHVGGFIAGFLTARILNFKSFME